MMVKRGRGRESFTERKRDYKGNQDRELGRYLEMKRTHESERQ